MAASIQKIRDAIDNAVKGSTEIKPGNYVTVKVEKKGLFGKPFIVLTGRCTSDKDKDKVEEIARAAAGDVQVESRLRVSTVS
jgi:osmotically-inducible protein OsmY